MDKFTSQVQIEETADFQEWLDAQEVADIPLQGNDLRRGWAAQRPPDRGVSKYQSQ